MIEQITLLCGYSIIILIFSIRIIYDIKTKKYKSMALFTILVLVMFFLISKIKF